METGTRDKPSNLPPLTWGQQMSVSDKMLNPQEKVLTPPACITGPGQVGKASLGWEVKIGPFCTWQKQGESREWKCLSPPYQAISGPGKGDGKNLSMTQWPGVAEPINRRVLWEWS